MTTWSDRRQAHLTEAVTGVTEKHRMPMWRRRPGDLHQSVAITRQSKTLKRQPLTVAPSERGRP